MSSNNKGSKDQSLAEILNWHNCIPHVVLGDSSYQIYRLQEWATVFKTKLSMGHLCLERFCNASNVLKHTSMANTALWFVRQVGNICKRVKTLLLAERNAASGCIKGKISWDDYVTAIWLGHEDGGASLPLLLLFSTYWSFVKNTLWREIERINKLFQTRIT